MAFLLINPDILPKIATECLKAAVPDLEVSDCRDDYGSNDGDGVWIRPFLEFIEGIVAERCRLRGFQFSCDDRIDDDQLEEIPVRHVRALISQFINAEYESFRNEDVTVPDYNDVRSDCRGYCEDCESGWSETHAEYEGPLEEDVDADEDTTAPGLSAKERVARRTRNLERERERERRRDAREEAESEVVDREFVCDDDCDGFVEHVDEAVLDGVEVDSNALKVRLVEFLRRKGEGHFPPLHTQVRQGGNL